MYFKGKKGDNEYIIFNNNINYMIKTSNNGTLINFSDKSNLEVENSLVDMEKQFLDNNESELDKELVDIFTALLKTKCDSCCEKNIEHVDEESSDVVE